MIIGLCGRARSGKDTIGRYMEQRYGYATYAFASNLKRIVADIFMLSDDQVNGDGKDEVDVRYDMTPRKMLQHVGTDGFRALVPDVWLRRAEKDIRELESRFNGVLVTDTRFGNEASNLRERFSGELWMVRRPNQPVSNAIDYGHVSETELAGKPSDFFDVTIVANWDDLDDMYAQVDEAMLGVEI